MLQSPTPSKRTCKDEFGVHILLICKGTTFLETAKFYGIFSVTITRMSIFQVTLYSFISWSCAAHRLVEKTEFGGGYNEGKVLFLRNV